MSKAHVCVGFAIQSHEGLIRYAIYSTALSAVTCLRNNKCESDDKKNYRITNTTVPSW